jgi:dTDP-glucose 4,6-dehydratase
MNILVTGGAGFIGSNFIRYILDKYPEDTIINYDVLTYAGNLENLRDIEKDPRYSFIKGDVCDFESLKSASKGVGAIIHFAAESHVDRSVHSSHEFLNTAIMGTQTVIDVIRALEIPKYVHISTDEVYGDIDAPGKSKEGDMLEPSSPYSASKAGAELLVMATKRTHGIPAMITRCTNNYGPYHYPEKIIPLFITNAFTNQKVPVYDGGMQIRDWLYVTDHCSAIDAVLRKGTDGEIYNISADQNPEVTNLELTKMILKACDKGEDLIEHVSGLRPGHDQRYALDSTKIRAELGWKPNIELEIGLAQTVKWFKENENWWKRVKSGEYKEYYKKHYGN